MSIDNIYGARYQQSLNQQELIRDRKWNQRFMAMARLVAMWSKDPSTKVGAVIVDDDKKVLGLGFNGFARGADDSPEKYADRDSKLGQVIHSEVNAILNAGVPLKGATIYVSSMCCPGCAAVIIQSGIKRVVTPHAEEDPFSHRGDSSTWKDVVDKAPKDFLDAGVELHVMQPTGFSVLELMGPDHPFMAELAKAKSDAINRRNK